MKINLFEYFERTANLFSQKIAIGGIRKHILSRNHSEIFLSPVVEKVGIILQKVMDSDDSES